MTTESNISSAIKPWRLDYDKCTQGDPSLPRTWCNVTFNWLKKNQAKDDIFDFRRSQWTWSAGRNHAGTIGPFTHPQSVKDLKASTDTQRFPYYIEIGTKSEPASVSKVPASEHAKHESPDDSSNSLDQTATTSWFVLRENDSKIETKETAAKALVTTINGFTNDTAISNAAITKWGIDVDNPMTLFDGNFVNAYNDHLRRGSEMLEPFIPCSYEFGISQAIWQNANQMLEMVFQDLGIEVSKIDEEDKIPPLHFVLNWHMFSSNHFGKCRSLIQNRIMQNQLQSIFGNFSSEPLNVDLFRPNSDPFSSEDMLSPAMAFLMFACGTTDIPLYIKKEIVTDLAKNIKKNEVDITLADFVQNRKYLFDRIDSFRQKRLQNGESLTSFNVSGFRAEIQNPKPKEKSTAYNRFNQNRNGKIISDPVTDSFGFANPHKSLPVYQDHPINKNLDDKNKGRQGRESKGKDKNRDKPRDESKSKGRGKNNRSSRDNQSRGKHDQKKYRSLDAVEDEDKLSQADDDASECGGSEYNDPHERSDNEGKVVSKNNYNSLTTAISRRINLNRVIYRKVANTEEINFAPSPVLPVNNVLLRNCFLNKLNEHKPVVILDTGADTSLISAELLFSLEKSRYSRGPRNPYASSKSATGDRLRTLSHLYDVELLCNHTRIKLKNVVVAQGLPEGTNNQVLLGWSDCADKKIEYQFVNHPETGERMYEVFMGKNRTRILGPCHVFEKEAKDRSFSRIGSFETDREVNEKVLKRDRDFLLKFRCCNLSTEPKKAEAIRKWLNTSQLHQVSKDSPRFPTTTRPTKVDNWSCQIANTNSKYKDEDDWRILSIKTEEMIRKFPVKSTDIATMHKLEKRLFEQRNVNTVNDVQIDPHGNVLPKGPEGVAMRNRILEILNRHKRVFGGDTGDAGDVLTTDVEIRETGQNLLTLNTARNMMNSNNEIQKEMICQKLDSELACGTLQRAMGRKVKNFLPIFLVPKKNATPDDVIVDASKNRMISNCKTVINNITKHVASSTDDADKAVRDTVGFTKKGWSFSCDISDAFHCIRLPQHLQPYFGILHPRLGPCMYTRLVQGWISSPQICRDFFTSVLANVQNISRYVDDIMGGANTFEELLEILDQLLGTLEYYNLRLKGSKMIILTKKIPFLGKELENGTVNPSRHHIEKLTGITWEKMPKGKDLRPYLGLYQYVAPFLWKSSDALHKLHRAAALDAKDIPWTANDNELIKELQKSKDLLKNTVPLSPLNRAKDLYLVVDTSQIATGALLLQKNDSESPNKYNVLGIFSRKRSDLENKNPTPSCVAELGGISSAVAHFRGQIADINEDKSVIILTDSQSAVACWKKYLRDNHPSTSMRISSFIASMYDIKYQLRFLPNIGEEIQLADWFSRVAANEKICPSDCKICNVAKTVTGHDFRRLSGALAAADYKNEFVPPSGSSWLEFEKLSDAQKDDFMDAYMDDTSFMRKKEIYVAGTGNEIRRALASHRVVRRKDICPFAGTVDALLRSPKVLSEWQKLDQTIRTAIKVLKEGLDVPTKDVKVRTLVDKYKVKLDGRGILITVEDDGMDTKNRVVLPVCVVKDVVGTVHDNMNHGSVNGILNQVNKIFHFAGREYFGKENPPSVTSAVKAKVRNCPGCARIAPNRLSKEPFKVVPIPETIGSVLIMDEFSRLNRKKEVWRFVLVTDSLSRFSMIYDYDGHMNSTKFKKVLKNIQKDFMSTSTGTGEECAVEVICDELAVHASAMASSNFIDGLSIKCKETASMSKNVLPELDGRLAKISRIMRAELANPKATRADVAYQTARKYNSCVGSEGFCPLELWRSRRLFSKEQFLVQTKVLREGIARSRRLNRETRDRLKGSTPSLRQFVPYEEGVTCYSNKLVTPLKLGDIIVPFGPFDKNDSNPLYIISAHPTVESGCDFDNSVVFCRKIGVQERSNNIHAYHFSAIHKVVDGNSEESKLFLSEQKSFVRWLMFERDRPMDLKPDFKSPYECYDVATGSTAADAYFEYVNYGDSNDQAVVDGSESDSLDPKSTEDLLNEAINDVSTNESVSSSDSCGEYDDAFDESVILNKNDFFIENPSNHETTFDDPEKGPFMLTRLKDSFTGYMPNISRSRLRSGSRTQSFSG